MVSRGETWNKHWACSNARKRVWQQPSVVRVLFDQGTPVPLRNYLPEHRVATAAEMGWSTLSNGELLDAAECEFDFAGHDRSSIAGPTKSVEAQDCDSSFALCKLAALEPNAEIIASRVSNVRSGQYVEIDLE